MNQELKKRLLLLAIICLIAGFFIYGHALQELFEKVVHREDSSHGVFIPFFF